jgi:hypothetical protein
MTQFEQTEAPFIYQIQQADPRSPYKLVAWAKLLAGADVPAASPREVGSPQLAADSEGLAMTPEEALAAYATAKSDPSAEQAAAFDTAPKDGVDPDPTRARWTALVTALGEGAASLGGAFQQASSLVDGSVFAVATADSGALVFGQILSTADITLTPVDGATVNLGPKGYLGLGAETLAVTQSAHIEYLQTVVLAVPAEGADRMISVVAVADTPTSVKVV